MTTPKPWLASYPLGVPASVDVEPAPNLPALLDQALLRHAERPAFTCMGRTTSYAELDGMSRAFAAWIQSQGVNKGDRVAVMMPNLTPFVVAVLGTLRAGGVVVTVNPLYTPRELAHQLKDSGARTLVVFEAFAPTVKTALAEVPLDRIVCVGGKSELPDLPGAIGFGEVLKAGAQAVFAAPQFTSQDTAFLQYTGGTTGISKGAMLTHGNLLANIVQLETWLGAAMPPQSLVGNNVAGFLPLYHIFALTFCVMWGLHAGLHSVLIANPRDLPGAAKDMNGLPIHLMPGVNTLFAGLAANPDLLAQINLTELRFCLGGGSAVQKGTADRWLAATGVPICEGYGLSETSPLASLNLADTRQWTGTIGLPVPNTDFAIRDDEGRELPFGERGEICIRGPQVMAGYWQRPDETAKVMTADAYFKSGDIGVMDERGFVKIVDRKKDMILVSGFNVFPNEIEDVVSTMAGVAESAAIGVPDEKSGEAVKLFVVRRDPALTCDDVQAHCRANLTGYKVPKHVAFLDALPKSTVGKVLRRELRG